MKTRRNRFDNEDKWITRGIYVIWVITGIISVVVTIVAIHFIKKFW